MLRFFATAILGLFLIGSDAAWAEDCAPRCDFWHYYGPYDFGYVRPGMVGYPICDREGNCTPHLVYTYPGRRYGRVTVRSVSRPQHNPDAGHSLPPSSPDGR
jgi:hypothetical protein